MSTSSEHIFWLTEIQNKGVNLTVWEEEFIENIARRLDMHQELSSKQAEILERIYAEKTP